MRVYSFVVAKKHFFSLPLCQFLHFQICDVYLGGKKKKLWESLTAKLVMRMERQHMVLNRLMVHWQNKVKQQLPVAQRKQRCNFLIPVGKKKYIHILMTQNFSWNFVRYSIEKCDVANIQFGNLWRWRMVLGQGLQEAHCMLSELRFLVLR